MSARNQHHPVILQWALLTVTDQQIPVFSGKRYKWEYSGESRTLHTIHPSVPSNLLPHLSPPRPPSYDAALRGKGKASRMYLPTYVREPVLPVNLLTSALPTGMRKCCSPGREESIGDATRTTPARRRILDPPLP
jgi:hypothetical protein